MFNRQDTIAAIATAHAPAAIGIVRISGAEAASVLRRIVPSIANEPVSRRIMAGWARHPGTDDCIDEVLCFFCKGPGTATGEDISEIHGHGGPLILNQLLDAVLVAGARPAEPGEFTYRAFANGRLDLTQAEAVMGLIGARSDRAARVALNQLSGGLGKALADGFEALNRISAHVEATLDFPDEDLPVAVVEDLAGQLDRLTGELETLRDSFDLGAKLGDGARIAIIGPPNAGKSSLFNQLVHEDRAIVDEDPGTTRDVIEAHGVIAGIPVQFLDTAGLREDVSRVERLGIERSRAVARGADLVILVLDGSATVDRSQANAYASLLSSLSSRCLLALNKNDLPGWTGQLPFDAAPSTLGGVVAVSALTGEGLAPLLKEIGRVLGGDCPGDTVILTTARQHQAVSDAAAFVRAAEERLRNAGEFELIAAELLWAREKIAALLGRSTTEDMLSSLFSEFCIGK